MEVSPAAWACANCGAKSKQAAAKSAPQQSAAKAKTGIPGNGRYGLKM
jgi:hypothetical protein